MQQPVFLPGAFADLAPLVEEWGALETQDERYQRRRHLPMERLHFYYDLVQPRLDDIFRHLDSFAFGHPLPEPQALLLRVVLAMSEVAQAVEVYGEPDVPNLPANYQTTIRSIDRA